MLRSAPPETTKFFTIREAAAELHVSRAAIHAAIKKGRLSAEWGETTRVVKALLIPEKALKAFEVDQQKIQMRTSEVWSCDRYL